MKKITMFLGSLLLSTAVFAQSNTTSSTEVTTASTERGNIEVGLDLVSPLLDGYGLYAGIALSHKFVLQARLFDYTVKSSFYEGEEDYQYKNSSVVLALDFYPLGSQNHSGWYITAGAQSSKVKFSSDFSDSKTHDIVGARVGSGYSWSGIRLGDSLGMKFKVGGTYTPTGSFETSSNGDSEVSGGISLDGSVSLIF